MTQSTNQEKGANDGNANCLQFLLWEPRQTVSKYITGTDMICPDCGSQLKEKDVGQYETLCEHVQCCGISEKQSYGCSNDDCRLSSWRWLYDGEGPYMSNFGTHKDLVQRVPVGTFADYIEKSTKGNK